MKKNLAVRLGAIVPFVLVAATSAHAALPTEVTTAIADTGTDMTSAITAIITAFIGFWGLNKMAGKLGWK